MTKDKMIEAIQRNYVTQTQKCCEKISGIFESSLRNAYNQGFKAGEEACGDEYSRYVRTAREEGVREGLGQIHARVEQGKQDGYTQGVADAFDTLKKILTVYPMSDMRTLFAPNSHGQEEDWRLVFDRNPQAVMNTLAEYEKRRQKAAVWLNTTGE